VRWARVGAVYEVRLRSFGKEFWSRQSERYGSVERRAVPGSGGKKKKGVIGMKKMLTERGKLHCGEFR